MRKSSLLVLVLLAGLAAAGWGAPDLRAWVLSLEPISRLRTPFSLQRLESVAGMAVFRSGPHRDGRFDFQSTTEFGHYRPEFLRLVIDTLLEGPFADEKVRAMTEKLARFGAYRDRLYSLGAARCAIARDPARFSSFSVEYRKLIAGGARFSAYGSMSTWGGDGYNPEDLAFWARREWDGTSALVTEGVRKALRLFAFPTYQAHVSCLQGEALAEPAPFYFTLDSFLDHRDWGDPSALGCRDELIRRHAWSTDPARGGDFPRTTLDARITDQRRIADALRAAGCAPQWVAGAHYGLVARGRALVWRPVDLTFELEFSHYDGCGPTKIVDLRVAAAERPENLILFRAGEPSRAPGFYTRARARAGVAPADETVELRFGEVPGLERVVLTRRVGPIPPGVEPGLGRDRERLVPLEITLWAEFSNGKRTRIASRHAIWKYTFSAPVIENVTIMDVNGDGAPDFLYDTDNLGRYLALTRDGELVDVITLVTDQYSGVGGC